MTHQRTTTTNYHGKTISRMCIEAEIVEEKPLYWGPWATIGFTLALFAACVLVDTIATAIAFVVLKIGNPKADAVDISLQLQASGLLLSAAAFYRAICCAGLIALFIKARRRLSLREYLALIPVRGRVMAFWLAAVLVFGFCSDSLTYVLDRPIVPQFMIDAWHTSGWPPILWLAVIVAAPLAEELVFRGFFFVGLRQFPHGDATAVLVTSLVWASIHLQYNIYQTGVIFGAGILLGIARIRSGSLYVPLAMHGFFNLLATIQAGITIYATNVN